MSVYASNQTLCSLIYMCSFTVFAITMHAVWFVNDIYGFAVDTNVIYANYAFYFEACSFPECVCLAYYWLDDCISFLLYSIWYHCFYIQFLIQNLRSFRICVYLRSSLQTLLLGTCQLWTMHSFWFFYHKSSEFFSTVYFGILVQFHRNLYLQIPLTSFLRICTPRFCLSCSYLKINLDAWSRVYVSVFRTIFTKIICSLGLWLLSQLLICFSSHNVVELNF